MIAIACDHGGFELKAAIKEYLTSQNIAFIDMGCDSASSVDYPIYAEKVEKPSRTGSVTGEFCCAEPESGSASRQTSLRGFARRSARTASPRKPRGNITMPMFCAWADA